MSVAELREAQQVLAEFQARFQDLAGAASDWLWGMDAELRFTHITNGVRRFNGGVDPAIYYGKSRQDVGIPEGIEPEKWHRHLADLNERREFRNLEYTNVDPAGGHHRWSISGKPAYDSKGDFYGYRGVGRDITEQLKTEEILRNIDEKLKSEIEERRQAAAALRDIEQRYRDIFDNSSVATTLVAPDEPGVQGRLLHVTQAFCDLLGYTEDELLTMTIKDLTHSEDHQINANKQGEISKGVIEHFQLEKRLLDKSGRVVWIELSVTVVRDDQGRYLYDIGHHQNITELKNTEIGLRQSRERFQDFAEASADWFGEMDADLKFTYMSPGMEKQFGRPAEWYYGKTRLDLLGDDNDPEAMRQHFELLDARKPFRNFTYRRTARNGETRWARISGVPFFSDDGEFLGYRGAGSDVTELFEADQAQRKNEAQLRMIADNLPALVNYTDTTECLRFCNKVAETWYAKPLSEIIGKTARQVLGEKAYAKLNQISPPQNPDHR